ncbi:hypothetical protein ATCC90586_011426 [Pythium insidiosum]|nr:hypothetical protein ATCC90586_011426 [Pythium insidiosum]
MFLLLPVSRGHFIEFVFRNSFERIVKYHRWLGMALSIATLVHMLQARQVVSLTSRTKQGDATPLYGFIAFMAFMVMAVTANEVRSWR